MKFISLFIIFLCTLAPAFVFAARPSPNDLMAQMQTQLDLSQEQVSEITPVINKYALAYQDLQHSIDQNSINPSAIDSQRKGIEAQETQEISQYLKPYQLNEWNQMQAQMDASGDADAAQSQDQYSNYPTNPASNP